jgi:hypothetical protein
VACNFLPDQVVVDGWLASGQATGEPAQQLLGVKAEPLEQVGVLVGVDLVGEFLVGLVSLVVLALLAEQIKDRALVELHGAPHLLWLEVGGRDASTAGVLPRRPAIWTA